MLPPLQLQGVLQHRDALRRVIRLHHRVLKGESGVPLPLSYARRLRRPTPPGPCLSSAAGSTSNVHRLAVGQRDANYGLAQEVGVVLAGFG